jgi:elongation factor G
LPFSGRWSGNPSFRGIIDLLTMEAAVWDDDDLGAQAKIVEIPEDFREQADEARQIIIERIVETDDELMERYLG